ncbi:protozoan cyanobacterial globin family protein [Stylonychia lemnae]|uniref:Protozoan cyanobacterial globin family protein n=1 Tax=Stylonychia lemnae TaxID=5949 RepID=A0A078BB46_STYLE|nr:protozoan cyanobacterial globin family protein [Stylonychia lemnae]|eukprot:CDW90472.1 protozoan cyanobacterial globin family protein [Stylonychia lemnae]
MGNYSCTCDNRSDENGQVTNTENTPRNHSKPEKLPSISHAVKSSIKKVNNERKDLNSKILVENNNNSNGALIQSNDPAKQLIQEKRQQMLEKGETKLLISENVLKQNIFESQQKNQNQENVQVQDQKQKGRDLEESKGDRLLQNSQNQSIQNQQQQAKIQTNEPKTLYDKLGGDEGCKIFVSNTMKKVFADPQFNQYFKNINLDLHNEKFTYFIGYLTGAHQHWIGQSLHEAHSKFKINDNQFDGFVSHCVQSMKEMRVKQDCLREMVKVLQNLRDQFVSKQEEEPQRTLLDKLGGQQNVKILAESTMNKVLECTKLKPYFDSTPISLHQKRLASYIVSIIGSNEQEWIGRSLKQSHQGKDISEAHFDLMIKYIEEAARELKGISNDTVDEFMKVIKGLEKDIVEENKSITLLEKIDNNDFFEPVMNRFVDKMMKDHILGRYFQNMKMKHMIPNKIMLFFAYSKGIMNPDDKQSIRAIHQGLKISPEDFERSIIFFKESLYEFCIDPAIVEEAVQFYKTLRKELAYYPEDHIEEIKREGQQYQEQSRREQSLIQEKMKSAIEEESHKRQMNQILDNIIQNNPVPHSQNLPYKTLGGLNDNVKKDSDNRISSFRLESENPKNQSDISSFIVKGGSPVEHLKQLQLSQPKQDLDDDLKVIEEKKIEESIAKLDLQQSKNQESKYISQTEKIQSLKFDDIDQEPEIFEQKEQLPQEIEIIEQEEKQQIVQAVQEFEKLKTEIQEDKSVIIDEKRKQQGYQQQTKFKYFFYDLLSGETGRTHEQRSVLQSQIFQGELNRFMEKQKSQLPRWLVLNNKALFIYKDELNAKSFPQKPLYAIPLPEISQVNSKEVLLHPNQRKNQALHFLEIELREKYGQIAQSIAQLFSGSSIKMSNPNDRNDSPVRENKTKYCQKQNISHQNHSYDDQMLFFVSQSKKSVSDWHRRLKNLLKQECNFNQDLLAESSIRQSDVKDEKQDEQILFNLQQEQPQYQQPERQISIKQQTQQLVVEQADEVPNQEQKVKSDEVNSEKEDIRSLGVNQQEEVDSFKEDDDMKSGNEQNGQQIQEQNEDIQKEEIKEAINQSSNNHNSNNQDDEQKVSSFKRAMTVKHTSQNKIEQIDVPLPQKTVKKPLKFSIGKLIHQDTVKDDQISKKLYYRLGGQVIIEQLVDEMFNKINKDQKLKIFFQNNKDDKQDFEKFMTYITEGSSIFIMNPLIVISKKEIGSQFKKIDFDKIAGCLVTTLQGLSINQDLINELIQILLPQREQFND